MGAHVRLTSKLMSRNHVGQFLAARQATAVLKNMHLQAAAEALGWLQTP